MFKDIGISNEQSGSTRSGLLLSVDPTPEHRLHFADVGVDDDNAPADTDADDTVGGSDYDDDTDTDIRNDADGVD